jgi:hypothetical protein
VPLQMSLVHMRLAQDLYLSRIIPRSCIDLVAKAIMHNFFPGSNHNTSPCVCLIMLF